MSKQIEYSLEIPINSSPRLLYNYLATPSGLSDWFADNVNLSGDRYRFEWDDSEEVAILISKKTAEYIRFRWEENENEDCFFELRIQRDKITKDVSVLITDFAEEDEIEDSKLLWESQIDELIQVIGG